jgi:hypothetical protein
VFCADAFSSREPLSALHDNAINNPVPRRFARGAVPPAPSQMRKRYDSRGAGGAIALNL